MALPRTTIEQWAVLSAVVEHGSFARAAAALHRSQPAVSYAVANLQEALGLPLLELRGRKAVLTAHGETLLKRARVLVRDLESLERLARVLGQGWEPELRLVVDAAFPRARLLQIVAELQGICPSTQLQLEDAVLSGAEEAITDGKADVVVTAHVPPGFLGTRLLDVTFVAVAHPGHPLFRAEHPLGAADLARHTQAVIRDSGTRSPRDDGWLGGTVRCTVTSVEASLATVLAGIAYAWLPEHLIAAPLREGTLRALPLAAGGTRTVPLYLVVVRPELAGPAVQAVVESFQRHVPASAAA